MKKVLLTLILTSFAHANELRIYSGFAEVIQPVQVKNHQFNWTVGEEDLCQVIPSSLAVQGAEVTQYTSKLQQTSWLESLTGNEVKVRLSEGTLDGTVQKVEGETLFVQEQGTDLVYPVQASQLVFQGLPPITRDQTGLLFQFTLKNETKPLLRYFTRSIGWSPNYTLDVNGQSGKLTGWANIQNRTGEALKVNRADLFSGNFHLPSGQFEHCDGGVPRPLAPNAGKVGGNMTTSLTENRVSTPILTSGGLYRQQISRPFEVPAQGHLNLALKTEHLPAVKHVLVAYRSFSTSRYPAPFHRQYRFTAPVFLQAAPITVRDNGFFVGEAYLQETPKGGLAFLNMGDATDVTHGQTVKLLSEVKVKNKVQSRTYQVNVTFKSLRDQPVDLRYTYDVFHSRKGQILVLDPGWQKAGRGLTFSGILKARASKTLSFKVRFEYQ